MGGRFQGHGDCNRLNKFFGPMENVEISIHCAQGSFNFKQDPFNDSLAFGSQRPVKIVNFMKKSYSELTECF